MPLLALTLLGALSYVRVPVVASSAAPKDNGLQNVMDTLRGLFVPLFGTSKDTVLNADPLPILMYHYVRDNVSQVDDPLGYGLSMPPAEFAKQLQYLADNGYTTVTMSQVVRGDYDAKSVALTFDDGYKDFISEAYPLLERYDFTATVYVISGRLQDSRHLAPTDIVYLANRGIEIGSHSVNHLNLTRQSADGLAQELSNSQKTLSNIINKPVTALSYPAGQHDNKVIEAAHKLGYTSAVTVVEGRADPAADLMRLSRIRIRRSMSEAEFARKLAL